MSSETAHVQLREHLGNDGESFKIVKEVMSEVEPDTDNVVFFMELITLDQGSQAFIDQANRGVISYREAFLQASNPEIANDDEYPLVRSLSHTNWGRQITNLVYLKDNLSREDSFAWSKMVYNRFNTIEASDLEFKYSRAGEYDRLRSELYGKRKRFYVLLEDGPKFLEKLQEEFGTNSEQEFSPEEGNIEEQLVSHVRLAIQNIAIFAFGRDEINAKYLRDRVSDLTGKTEVYSHFGTLHKGFPGELKKQGFNIKVQEAETYDFMEKVHMEVGEFLESRGINCWELAHRGIIQDDLVSIIFEKYQVDLLASFYTTHVTQHLPYKGQVKFYKDLLESLEDYTEQERIAILRGKIEEIDKPFDFSTIPQESPQ